MIIVVAVVTFSAERTDEMLVAAEQAEKVCRTLRGCQSYLLATRVGAPGELLACEVWDDAESFEHHVAVAEEDESLTGWRDLVETVTATVYDVAPHKGDKENNHDE